MNEPISKDTFDHLVDLAALELDPAESQYLLDQMNHQIKAIQELELIPLETGTPPARHGVPFSPEISPGLRADEIVQYENVEDLLSAAPVVEDRYIIVPDIPHTELE